MSQVPNLDAPFFQPWIEVEPTGAHGGLPGELEGFVAPRLRDNARTKNIDLCYIFDVLRDATASISMHPMAMKEGPPGRNVLEEVFRALNWIFERIVDRTRTEATSLFIWTHATPPWKQFGLRPIRYPVRCTAVNHILYFLLGTAVETAEVNANGNHASLDPSSSWRIIAGLYHLKATLIKDYFDQEVQGEISLEELNTMFAGIASPGPTIVTPDTSQPAPTPADVAAAVEGVDVLQWYPSEEMWSIFGRKNTEMYKTERIWQPEGAIPTTEDVAPENTTPAGGGVTPG